MPVATLFRPSALTGWDTNMFTIHTHTHTHILITLQLIDIHLSNLSTDFRSWLRTNRMQSLCWPPKYNLFFFLSVFFFICPPEQRAHCAICADRIWGLGRQGYKCINCKLLVHKKCHKLVTVECGRPVIQVRPVINVMLRDAYFSWPCIYVASFLGFCVFIF